MAGALFSGTTTIATIITTTTTTTSTTPFTLLMVRYIDLSSYPPATIILSCVW